MFDLGWDVILENSEEINNSFKKIHCLMKDYQIFILTKVNSDEEQKAKALFLKKKKIFNVIFVPYNSLKSDVVKPFGSILIDDVIYNLEEWEQNGGISILFNEYMKNEDSYGNKSSKFIIIDDLLKICDIIKNR